MSERDLVKAYRQELKQARREEERKRALQAIEDKVARGEVTFKVPRGYRNVRKGTKTWVEFDPACAHLVLECFQLAETGRYSVDRIRKEMATKGLVGKNGKLLALSSMWTILTNPFYCGQMRRKGRLLPGNHPCLISQKLFDNVQGQMKKPSE